MKKCTIFSTYISAFFLDIPAFWFIPFYHLTTSKKFMNRPFTSRKAQLQGMWRRDSQVLTNPRCLADVQNMTMWTEGAAFDDPNWYHVDMVCVYTFFLMNHM